MPSLARATETLLKTINPAVTLYQTCGVITKVKTKVSYEALPPHWSPECGAALGTGSSQNPGALVMKRMRFS